MPGSQSKHNDEPSKEGTGFIPGYGGGTAVELHHIPISRSG